MTKPSILIAMPTYNATMGVACERSLSDFIDLARSRGIKVGKLPPLSRTGIVGARNILASRFYELTEWEQLLFLDDDMDAQAKAIMRLPDSGKPFIGLACPLRGIDLTKLCAEARKHDDKTAIARSLKFNINPLGKPPVDGLQECRGIGMGVTLIARTVFEQIVASGKVRKHVNNGVKREHLEGPLYGFFDHLYNQDSGEISEDYSICARWRTFCKGDVLAVIDEVVGHVGEMTFRAIYADAIKT